MSKNVPVLRFPGFVDDWNKNKLLNYISLISGQHVEVKFCNADNEGIRYITGPSDFHNGVVISNTYTDKPGKICEKDDILVTVKGSGTGRIFIADQAYCISRQLMAIRAKKISSTFLYHFIEKSMYKVKLQAVGLIPGISRSDILDIKEGIPNINEQNKIASFLSFVDSKIDLLTKKKELMEQYKKGIMQKIFSQKIRFKDDNGNDYPDWKEKKLGEITKNISVKNKENLSLPVYSISNKYGFIPQGEQFEGMDSDSRGYDLTLYKIISKNTFAYNPARINVGSLGYSGELENIIISSLYVCFKTSNEIYDSFLLSWFDTFTFNKSVIRNTEGGVRDYLFYNNFANIKFSFPCLDEQQKISSFLSSIDSKISQIDRELSSVQKFKKGLLQKMFV